MSAIRGRDTKPELLLLEAMRGATRRKVEHQPALPGRPDFLVKSLGLVVFVDGCFWHGCPSHYKPPKTNARFWRDKVEGNRARDRRNRRRLRRLGYSVLSVWEHQVMRSFPSVPGKIASALRRP
jgi:DNA mismatch endonuclease (patch repair protein)